MMVERTLEGIYDKKISLWWNWRWGVDKYMNLLTVTLLILKVAQKHSIGARDLVSRYGLRNNLLRYYNTSDDICSSENKNF